MATNTRQSNFKVGNYTGKPIYINNSESLCDYQLSIP